jgi:hypothetical protein
MRRWWHLTLAAITNQQPRKDGSNMPELNQPQTTSNSFAKALAEMRKGRTLTELSTELESLIKAVRETGKKGELTLKLKVTPDSEGTICLVEDQVSVKTPKMDKASTTFFITDDNQLSRSDPRQEEMKFEVFAGAKTEPEDVKAASE